MSALAVIFFAVLVGADPCITVTNDPATCNAHLSCHWYPTCNYYNGTFGLCLTPRASESIVSVIAPPLEYPGGWYALSKELQSVCIPNVLHACGMPFILQTPPYETPPKAARTAAND